MKKYKIRQGDYSSREEVVVEIVEEVVEKKRTAITESNILKTIESLENKKRIFCDSVDAEIAINTEALAKIREVNKDAVLVEKAPEPVTE